MKFKVTLATLLLGLLTIGSAQAEKIRIATEGAYPPFNMKDTSGQLTGFDVDIAKALCAEMKADCEIVAQDWDGIIPGLLAKKYDAIIASMSITAERKQKVSFTDPYYSNYLRFIAKKNSGLTASKAGLKGKTLGAQRATISGQNLEDNYRKTSNIKVYDTQEAAFLDLKSGRLDAVLVDAYPGYDWLSKAENSGFDFLGDSIDINDKIGIAIRKGDKALAGKFNKALQALLKNGKYSKINSKYFPFSIY
jgi:putative lysine/arginine/ornithine/histidine/octopine transport system substrate-binding protein